MGAARINARAVLAKMRSKRGPLIWTVSQKFPRDPRDVRGPRSDQAPSGCEPDVDSPTQATARGSHCGRIWSILARCRLLATCGPIFFSTSVTGLQRRRFRIRDFGIEPERIELAVKRRAPNAQPPRDLGHLPAVMADGEADGLGFDVRKRAHVAAPVEQRDGGLVAEAAHRLVWEAALHRSFVDDQNALAHAATSQPCAELGTVADRAYRGVNIAPVVSASTGLILLAISSIARRRLRRLRGGRLTRGDLAPYPSSVPLHGRFWRRPAIIAPSQPVMPAQAKRAVAQRAPKSPPKSRPPSRLGVLPEWNLADLYAGIDDPQVKRDLDRGAAESLAFEEAYKGKLTALVERPDAGSQLVAAVKRYEALDDLLGRLTSYAGLLHAGDTVDPARAKFYADVQERVTAASTHLLFFTLELNRLDDAKLEAAMQDPALAHYRPWIEDVRKDKPYQLEDRVEQLFHEKSVTGYSAWNRLFDETIASLRFKVGSKSLAI